AAAGLGQGAGGDQHDVVGGHAGDLPDAGGHAVAHQVVIVGGGLGHHDHALAATPGDAEGDHVAGPHAVDPGDRALDVLGEHVPPGDDDDVLDATAEDELAVEEVREVAGAQPLAVEGRRGHVGPPVVTGHHRGAADLQL